jgi:RNA polymerase sigma factor (sigma-70 family)
MKDKKDLSELVCKAQSGDGEAMNDLIGLFYNDLYHFAYQTTKDPDTAADVTQEACIKIVTNLSQLEDPKAFRTWAKNITYHQSAQYFRQVRDLQPLETEDGESILDSLPDESEGSLPEQLMEDKEFKKTLLDMLDTLPAQQRSAMMLYYYEKLSVKQIAEVFETSEGTIKSRLNYGRKAMKDKVEQYEKKNGVRLHSSVLPLLLLWLFGLQKNALPKMAVPAWAELSGTVAQGAAVSSGAAISSGAAATSGTAATGTGMKIAAGVLAAIVAAGAAVGGVALLGDALSQKETIPETTAVQPPAHTHSFTLEFDSKNHWGECACGESTSEQAHTYEAGICAQCSYEPAPSDGLIFRDYEDYSAVTGIGSCQDTTIVIPATHNGRPVTGISIAAFADCAELEEVILPDSITDIGTHAFNGCDNLRRIHLGSGLKNIYDYAFKECFALEEISFPDGLEYIGSFAFYGCSTLTNVSVPAQVKEIGDCAFKRCASLQSLNLHGHTIKSEAFMECAALREITFGPGITEIGDLVFSDCTALQRAVLPEGLTLMGEKMFQNCTSLTYVSIPGSVTVIPERSFFGCTALSEVIFSEGLIGIDYGAFDSCAGLRRITLPAGLTYLSNYSFTGCSLLTEIVIPSGVTEIPFACFEWCTSLTNVTLPSGITLIDAYAFSECSSLSAIYYGGSVSDWQGMERYTFLWSAEWDNDTGEYTVFCTDGNISKEDAS